MKRPPFNENKENKRLVMERRIFKYAYHIPERRKSANRKNEYSFIGKEHHDKPAQLEERKIYT